MSFQTYSVPAVSSVRTETPGPSSTSGRSSPTVFESEQTPQSAKVWCEDIDAHVALLTTDGIAYRVQRDCLESVSRRLRHLIAKASKIVDKDSPFGCPTVHLDVSSSRLKPFLEVVTDPTGSEKITWLAYSQNSPNSEGCLSFSWLAAVARTAHELGAYHIRFAALTRIRRFFESDAPLQLVKHSKSFQANWAWWGRECGLTVAVEDAIEALNLSRLLLVPFRSPLALYACCLLPPAQLRSGVAREDGVVEKLSDEDFDRCMRALPSLHVANYRALVKTFAHAEDWKCRGAHACAGKHGMRKIRDAYIKHIRMPGPYRPDLRDLLSSLKFKSLPFSRLSAPEGSSRTLLCRECMKRLVERSETLCREEAANLEKYFFPEQEQEQEEQEEEEGVEGWMPRTPDDVDQSDSAPRELKAHTPPSHSEPESEPESEEPSGSSADTESTASPSFRISSPGRRSPSTGTSSPEPETLTSSPRSVSPAGDDGDCGDDEADDNDYYDHGEADNNDCNDNDAEADEEEEVVDDDEEVDDNDEEVVDDDDDEEVDEPHSPIPDGSKMGFIPRLEIEMPPPLSAMMGWDDHAGLDVDLLLFLGS